jgi:hypothetical protein
MPHNNYSQNLHSTRSKALCCIRSVEPQTQSPKPKTRPCSGTQTPTLAPRFKLGVQRQYPTRAGCENGLRVITHVHKLGKVRLGGGGCIKNMRLEEKPQRS